MPTTNAEAENIISAYILYDTVTGRIILNGSCSTETVELQATGITNAAAMAVNAAVDQLAFYVVDGRVVPRPATGIPVTHTIATSTDWIVPDVPEGTVVEIDGEEVGTVDATGLTLAFDLAGVWQVNLRPPFPWLNASCEVTVT